MSFKKTVQSMSAKSIIMSMVDSLTPPPIINVDMDSFGKVKDLTKGIKFLGLIIRPSKGICYGCAATNTVCKIAQKTFTPDNIDGRESRAKFIGTDEDFLYEFERAIDQLRVGDIYCYNYYARNGEFAKILKGDIVLPPLSTWYTKEDLLPYKQLAEAQPS